MRRYAWFLLPVLVLTALLVPILWPLVRDVLLVELLRLAWTVDRLVDSLPQDPFWLAFLFVSTLVAALSLLPRLRPPDLPLEPPRRPEGQLADLALLIRRAGVCGARAGRRPYFRRRLVQRLSHLGREVFAHQQGVELGPAGEDLPSVPGAPYPTGRFAQAEKGGDALHPGAPWQQALARLRTEPAGLRGTVDPAVEFFVQFLEKELEVEDGPFDRSRR